jgi:malate synthase
VLADEVMKREEHRREAAAPAMLTALERHLSLPVGTIKIYVLVEQIEASFQLIEIRAAPEELGAMGFVFNFIR